MDDVQLVFQPGTHLGRVGPLSVTHAQTFFTQAAQVACRIKALWHVKEGQVVALSVQVHVTTLTDEQGIVQRAGYVAKELLHLLPALEIIAVVVHAHAVGLRKDLARLDAEQQVVRFGVLAPHVMRVVGGDVIQLVARPPFQQRLVDGRQFGQVVVL